MLKAILSRNERAVVVSNAKLGDFGSIPTRLRQTFNPRLRGYIWRVGDNRSIQSLVQVLRDGSWHDQEEAAGVLRGLAEQSQNICIIREQGGITALIKVLQEGST